MTQPSPESGAPTRRAPWLAPCVVLGWVLHEAAVFVDGGEPRAVLELVPGWGACLLAGLAISLLWRALGRLAVFVALVLGVWSLWPGAPEGPHGARSLQHALGSLLAALAVAALFTRGRGRGALAAGLAAGVTASVLWAWRDQGHALGWPSFLVLGGGVGAWVLARTLAPPLRRRAIAGLVLVGAAPFAWVVVRDERLPRADRPRAPIVSDPTHGARPSLLLVVLDTVRADHLAAYGYGRDTMPELERFMARGGLRYAQARAASSWTLPSHASLLTGLLPAQHGATHPRLAGAPIVGLGAWEAVPLRADVTTLAERLAGAGYRTAGIVANAYYLNHAYGVDRGFEHWDDRAGSWVRHLEALPQLLGFARRTGRLLYRDATRITDLALAWVGEHPRDEPFFLFLNYMDAHAPYLPPAPFDERFGPARPRDPLALEPGEATLEYDRELAYLDHELGRLLGSLEREGRLANTLVVVTSDHGEALGEHGFQKHGWTLYDAVVRVPLFLRRGEGAGAPIVVDEPLHGAQVHDLVLGELGLGELAAGAPTDLSGEWFRVPDASRAAPLAGLDLERDLVSWIEDGRKVIASSHGKVEVYDLEADPKELRPLALDEATRAAALERAAAWWRAHPPAEHEPAAAGAAHARRLEALGYAGDG